VKIRLRPSYFQFTEPSVELDVSCFICGGTDPDCKVCKGAGWLEMLGAGMVDPGVLEEVGYDPEEFTGYAFGMGPDRMAMVKYGIPTCASSSRATSAFCVSFSLRRETLARSVELASRVPGLRPGRR
jgi:hypothetical protein